MKALNNIFRFFSASLLAVVAGVFLVSLLPIPSGIEIKIVQSGSMEPSIRVGSLVLIKPSSNYEAGDVITFGADTRAQVPTTHRIVSKRGAGEAAFYTTKGDANEEADTQETPQDDVIGKVLLDVPYAGYILDFAKQPLGFALLIGFPAALIILDELATIFRELMRMRARRVRGRRRNAGLVAERAPVADPRIVYAAPARIEYRRLNRMDDIRVPVLTAGMRPQAGARERGYAPAFFALLITASASLTLIGSIGSTVSYYQEEEISSANMLAAVALDFTAGPALEAFVDGVESVQIVPVFTPEPGSANTEYALSAAMTGGSQLLCDQLNAVSPSLSYSGPLLSLAGQTTDTGPIPIELSLSSDAGLVSGDMCLLDLAFGGWHEAAADGTGYQDEEHVSATITYLPSETLAPPLFFSAFSTEPAAPPESEDDEGEGADTLSGETPEETEKIEETAESPETETTEDTEPVAEDEPAEPAPPEPPAPAEEESTPEEAAEEESSVPSESAESEAGADEPGAESAAPAEESSPAPEESTSEPTAL